MKQRVNTLLEPETIEALNKEAKEKSISVSAVIRQKVEAMIKFQNECKKHLSNPKTSFPNGGIINSVAGEIGSCADNEPEFVIPISKSREQAKPCDHVFNRAKGVTYTKCFKCGGEI